MIGAHRANKPIAGVYGGQWPPKLGDSETWSWRTSNTVSLGHSRLYCDVRSLVRHLHTGQYHVRPRRVCLSPSCVRSANNGHSRRSSCVLASLDLATRDAGAVTKNSAYRRLQRTCTKLAPMALGLVLSDRNLAKGRAGTARGRPPTERLQDKSREVRPVGFGRRRLSACTASAASSATSSSWSSTSSERETADVGASMPCTRCSRERRISAATASTPNIGKRASANPRPRWSRWRYRRSSIRLSSKPCRRCSRRAAPH
jgi:hypothetical protein